MRQTTAIEPAMPTRRTFGCGLLASIGAVSLAGPSSAEEVETVVEEIETVRRNISAFRSRTWQPYFSNLDNGVILADTRSRTLYYWSEDESEFRLYPTSVPLSPELTRLGRTRVVRKVENPSWRPTEAMLKRNPDWPAYMPPGPENPMGTHALYLSWKYYRIHGTHDTRKIGRKSSNGCIGLYNEHIAELFELAKVGTQVLLI